MRVSSRFRAIVRCVTHAGFAAALLLFPAPAAAAAQAAPPTNPARLKAALQKDLDVYLRERSSIEHLSALSLVVSLGRDRPPIAVTAGTTRFHAGPPVTPANLFQIGSNTKAFTALAVLQLEAQGRLSIDAPIGAYVPQYPAYKNLTLRRLLSMTSGLESYDNMPSWEKSFAARPRENVSADSLIRVIYPSIKFTPGTTYHYSNTGYLLAQEIVAARSKSKSFDKELARIIASARLHDTFYTSTVFPPSVARRVVAGYYENNDVGLKRFLGMDMSGYSLSWAQGAGSIVSTPADLATWARAIYQGTMLLPAKQKRELTSMVSTKTARPIASASAGDPGAFGLGVAQRFDPHLGLFWFYQGETLGFRAAHLYFPKSDLVVCVFANSRPVETKSKLQALFATIYASIKATK